MKYLKLFENFDTPFPEEEDLIDYPQEFFDKYSIRLLDDIDDEYNDTNNYMIYHDIGASLSIDIYNDPDREAYKHLLSIQPNIERRLGYRLRIRVEDYSSSMSLYNIIIFKQ